MSDGEGPCPSRDRGTSGSDRGIASEVTPGTKSDQRTAARNRLPNRRRSETIEFDRDGSRYRMTIGYFPGGEVGEVFINADRANSTLDAFISDAAILVSLCIQYGVALHEITHALKRDGQGVAASPIGAALDRIAP